VIYGMWVAAGVVAEKTSRVMELMISAASPRQLVIGKVAGIGAAGVTQMLGILVPAIVAIVMEDPLATAVLGPGPTVALSLSGLSPALLVAFLVWFALGFTLFGLIYAAAGSLVSRAEDLQMLALPLSLIAIVGYLQAVLALTGGSPGFIRFASYVPFWSPFVMLTRLAVGRVEPWEVVLSLGLLIGAIALTFVVAVRVYAAGVLLYGQRPGFRAIARAAAGAK
jgi:ABC-2 type transport system permease protein